MQPGPELPEGLGVLKLPKKCAMGLYGPLFLWEIALVQLKNKPRDAEEGIEQSELYTDIMCCAIGPHALFQFWRWSCVSEA